MSPELLEAVRARALDPATRIDNFPLHGAGISSPLTDTQLAESIDLLGFRPPATLVDLYRAVGNGGFGPEYGLMGLVGGADDDLGRNAVELYLNDTKTYPNHPDWNWPRHLLHIADLGCAMNACIDCSDEEGRLVLFEPNVLDDRMMTRNGLFPMPVTFSEWMQGWVDGDPFLPILEAAMAAPRLYPQ